MELDDVVQSVGLNSIASFCFEDASVEGGLRFWLGKVMSMVHRPKTGRKKLLTAIPHSIEGHPSRPISIMCVVHTSITK